MIKILFPLFAILAALALSQTVPQKPVRPPDPPEKGARAVVATQVSELTEKWGGKNPRGTVKLPASRLKASGTVYLPARVSMAGPADELVIQDMFGIYAQRGFARGEDWSDNFVLATLRPPNNKQNSNANFDARLERVFVQCLPGEASSGVLWGGAQSSTVRDVCIWDATDYGLCLDYGSSRTHLDSVNIRNGNSSPSRTDFGPVKRPAGVGIRIPGCHGVSGINTSLHLCEVGLDVYASHNVTLLNTVCEKVDLIARTPGSSNFVMTGVDITASGRGEYPEGYTWHGILFDFRRHQGQVTVTGRISDTPSPVYYLNRRGVKVLLLAAGTGGSHGRNFKIELN